MHRQRSEWAVVGASAVAVMAAAAAAATGFDLDRTYRPPHPWSAGSLASGPSQDLIRSHQVLTWVVVAVSLALLAVCTWHAIRRRSPWGWVAMAVAVLALGGATTAGATLRPVHWDQIGLLEVTVGDDIEGWRAATDNDSVRMVLVGDLEFSPESYNRIRIGHLAGPLVAGAAAVSAAALTMIDRRRRDPDAT